MSLTDGSNVPTGSSTFGYNVGSTIPGNIPTDDDIPTSYTRTSAEQPEGIEAMDLTRDVGGNTTTQECTEEATLQSVAGGGLVKASQSTVQFIPPMNPPQQYDFFPYTPLAIFDILRSAHHYPGTVDLTDLCLTNFFIPADFMKLIKMKWLKRVDFDWRDGRATINNAYKLQRTGLLPAFDPPKMEQPDMTQRFLGTLVHAEHVARTLAFVEARKLAMVEGGEPHEPTETRIQEITRDIRSDMHFLMGAGSIMQKVDASAEKRNQKKGEVVVKEDVSASIGKGSRKKRGKAGAMEDSEAEKENQKKKKGKAVAKGISCELTPDAPLHPDAPRQESVGTGEASRDSTAGDRRTNRKVIKSIRLLVAEKSEASLSVSSASTKRALKRRVSALNEPVAVNEQSEDAESIMVNMRAKRRRVSGSARGMNTTKA